MSQLIETYIDRLLQDPNAPPPPGMDAETAAFVRALVATQSKPSTAQRARMWQRSLDAAKTATHAHSQTTTFHPSSNGHQVPALSIYGEEPMTTSSIRLPRQQRRSGSGLISILPLAAAIAFVVLGIALFASFSPTTPSLTTPPEEGSQGSLLGAETETATPVPFATPLIGASIVPTLVPEEAPAVLEYTIQEGDTLLFILVRFGFSDTSAIDDVIDEILRLNPSITSPDRLPAPGSVILIPVSSTTVLPTLVPGAETATPIPAVTLILTEDSSSRFPFYVVTEPPLEMLNLTEVPVSSTPFPATVQADSSTPTLVPIEIQPTPLAGQTEVYVLQEGDTTLDISSGTPTPVPLETTNPLNLTATHIVREATEAAFNVGVYVIQSGESILDILTRFDITLQTLAELNPQIVASGCDFSRLTGGVNCAFAMLTPGDEINVPALDLMPVDAASTVLPPTVAPPEETVTSTPFPRSDSAQPPTQVPTATPLH